MSPESKSNIPKPLNSARYPALDGWRGLASLYVVLSHLSFRGARPFAFGHEAVMLFFVISGYCITAAAIQCQNKGHGFGTFMRRRIHRILPPYACAVLYWIATRAVKSAAGGENELGRPWTEYLQNFTLTQWFSTIIHPVSTPIGNSVLFMTAFWSLGYEEQFYLVVGLLLILSASLRISLIVPVTVLGILSLAYRIVAVKWTGFFIEYWIQFAVGVLLFYRLVIFSTFWKRRVLDIAFATIASISLLAMIGLIPVTSEQHYLANELAVVSIFALVLVYTRSGSNRLMATSLGKILAGLGTISYSLYLIHECNLKLSASIAQRLVPASVFEAGNFVVQISIHLALAMLFWRFCEKPFLNKPLCQREGSYQSGGQSGSVTRNAE